MSEKFTEILTKLGFEPEKITDESNTDELITEFQARQRELISQDPHFIEPIKETVKTESSIVATKKAKKALNEKFGLGLSNTDLDKTEYSVLLDTVAEKSKSGATQEVNVLQEQILGLTNKLRETEESAESRIKEIEQTASEKFHNIKRSELLTKAVSPLELIIPHEQAVKFVQLDMQSKGLSIAFKEDGTEYVKQGEYEALTADRTSKLTVEAMVKGSLNDFTKKSNGTPPPAEKKILSELDTPVNEAMQKRMEEMRARTAVN